MITARKTFTTLGMVLFIGMGALAAFVISSASSLTAPIIGLIAVPCVFISAFLLPHVLRSTVAVIRSLTWWQFLWLVVFTSGLVFRDRDVQNAEANPVDAWALFRIALTFTAGAVLFLRLALRQTLWLRSLSHGVIGVLGSYCLVCFASCLWSVYPTWTLYKSVEFLVDVAAIAAVVTTAASVREYKMFFDWTWILEGLLLAAVWLNIIAWPQEALLPSEGLLGVQVASLVPYIGPNTIGEVGAVIGVIAFSRFLQRPNARLDRAWYGLLLFVSVVTMVLAQARSAIVGFFVGLALVLVFSKRVIMSVCLTLGGWLVLALGSSGGIIAEFMRRGESDSEIYTLSNRVDWWSFAWPRILEHPFIGYGAYAGAKFFVMTQLKVDAGIHSDWLEILVGTGLFGFILAVLALIITWRQLIRSVKDRSAPASQRHLTIEAIGVLAVVSVRSIFSPALFSHFPMLFLAILGYAAFLQLQRNQAGARFTPALARA